MGIRVYSLSWGAAGSISSTVVSRVLNEVSKLMIT